MNPYIYGFHEPGGEQLWIVDGERRGSIVFTHGIGRNPNDPGGFDYSPWAEQGFGVIARVNHGYGSAGTIPLPQFHSDFARRFGSFVKASKGCHVWIMANEFNHAQERPQGQPITPTHVADCFRLVRAEVLAQPGHERDLIAVGAVAPYNAETSYPGNESGNPLKYFTDVLQQLEVDAPPTALALHAYTHGADPRLITSEAMMGPPLQDNHFEFRTYRDYMARIPRSMRHLPVLITEADQTEPWLDTNNGWAQEACREIDAWNATPGNQTIRSLTFYRWPRYDKWFIEGKTRLHADFRAAALQGYRWDRYPVPVEPAGLGVRWQDLTDVLTRHPVKTYQDRPLNNIRHLVTHYSGANLDSPAEAIAKWHTWGKTYKDGQLIKDEWPGCGYHFNVRWDGSVEQCQRLRTRSYHAGSVNSISVGTCFPGNGIPTEMQIESGAILYAWLLKELGLSVEEAVQPHYKFSDTRCPGEWDFGARWGERFKERIQQLM